MPCFHIAFGYLDDLCQAIPSISHFITQGIQHTLYYRNDTNVFLSAQIELPHVFDQPFKLFTPTKDQLT